MSQPLHHKPNPSAIIVEGNKHTFRPQGFEIIWGKDKRFWKIEENVAELIQVYWLEVTGESKEEVSIGSRWKLNFNVSFNPDAFGWNGTTVLLMAKVGKKGKYVPKKIVDPLNSNNWCMDINVGAGEPEDDRKIYFGLYEMWSGKWKGGLKIHYASLVQIG